MRVVIFGATSAIAEATARIWAQEAADLVLVGRDGARLAVVGDDLRVRGAARVTTLVFDLADPSKHEELVAAVTGEGAVDIALFAYGVLPDQSALERVPSKVVEAMAVNATSAMALLMCMAAPMEQARSGTLAVIGSVSGDRGRRSNYVYAAAKGALERFTEGLRARLSSSGVHVVLIKPGWVATPMTAHLKRNFLFASADSAGRAIHRAIAARRNVVYVPGFWRAILMLVRVIPTPLFNRLRS